MHNKNKRKGNKRERNRDKKEKEGGASSIRAVAPLYLSATLRTAPPNNVTGAYPTGRAHATSQHRWMHNRTRQLRKMLADQQQKFTAAEKKCATLQDPVKVMADEIAVLREQLQIQSNSSVVHSPGVTWQYQNYCCWEAFTSEGNEKMHKAYWEYLSGSPNSRYSTISSGGVDRLVDFKLMQQKHMTTQTMRRIRFSAAMVNHRSSLPASTERRECSVLLQTSDGLSHLECTSPYSAK